MQSWDKQQWEEKGDEYIYFTCVPHPGAMRKSDLNRQRQNFHRDRERL